MGTENTLKNSLKDDKIFWLPSEMVPLKTNPS